MSLIFVCMGKATCNSYLLCVQQEKNVHGDRIVAINKQQHQAESLSDENKYAPLAEDYVQGAKRRKANRRCA